MTVIDASGWGYKSSASSHESLGARLKSSAAHSDLTESSFETDKGVQSIQILTFFLTYLIMMIFDQKRINLNQSN